MIHAFKKGILRNIVLEIVDIRSLVHLRNLYSDYTPWSGVATRPTALVYLLNDIIMHQRTHIVECGSGISTLLIASMLKQSGKKPRFCSIDHSSEWLDILRSKLEASNTADYVELVHAPLTQTTNGWKENAMWYDEETLKSCLSPEPIDLLFIDGPPASEKHISHSRYPALPFFKDSLHEGATVILDDSCRKPEREIATRWNREFGLNLEQNVLKGDIFLHTRGNRFNVL
jgi:predicted O-methyltransferase YrrM